MQKTGLLAGRNDETAKPDCTVSILHKRPTFGEGVEFLSVYYAKAKKDKQRLAEIFANAFIRAHPSWVIKKITVET